MIYHRKYRKKEEEKKVIQIQKVEDKKTLHLIYGVKNELPEKEEEKKVVKQTHNHNHKKNKNKR